jgi:lysozyme family protein
MTAQNYSAALKRVLAHEGGFSDHPKDPGGATMRGVTQRVYDAFRSRGGRSRQSVAKIEEVELQAIYREQYADKVRFNDLPTGVDYVVFDAAVNSGVSQAVKWLQRAVGVKDDGIMGAVTLNALRQREPSVVINDVCSRRLAMVKQLPTWGTFGRGWTSRIEGARAAGLEMAAGATEGQGVSVTALSAPKALVEDIAKPRAPVVVPTIGAGGGAVAVALETARQQIEPFVGMSSFINSAMVGLTLVSTIVAVGGVAYGIWAKHRRDQIKAAS